MLDRDQRITQAAMDYLALLEREEPVSIPEFVATVDPELREELAEHLELMLALGEPEEPDVLSSEDQALVERVASRVLQQHGMQRRPAQKTSLTELRKAKRLSVGKLASQLNVPPTLVARIERGGVLLDSIPQKFIERLAVLLEETQAAVQGALSAPQSAASGVRLSAEDGTAVPPEQAVSFAEALRAGGATPQQQQDWM